ncbi:Alpha/Beta hydrolase protein [Lophiotrema nucula]|uniref:Alpha/Beta hydrolase protein n=1 Tax=Lophiotrema nucula TaxID=690887 RepID=A0A6A5ZFD0_9PLEO|nr:Alpha/Beta hydrolase protein [Lophiotrema nucula]
MAILTYQPFKGLYTLGALGFEIARLPLWLVKYFLSYGRQHPEWSFGQAFGVRLFFSFVYHAATVQIRSPLSLKPGKEGERFVVLEPANSKYYKGPLLSNPDVKPVKIGGTWYPAPLTASSDTKDVTVIFHIHGGAFVIGDGRPGASGYFASKLLANSGGTHVFAPQYRLSTLPANKTSNPFPAAFQDSITSYLYLLNDLKIPASKIVLSGDSAGGNLAAVVLRYLSEFGKDLGIPNPAAAYIWSPWVNPATQDDLRTLPNYNTDYLSQPFTNWGVRAYAGPPGNAAVTGPYVNLKRNYFKSDVPMFVNTGSNEVLFFDDVEWAKGMKEFGNDVELDIEEGVPHDVLLLGKDLGFDKEATSSSKRAGGWLKRVRKL